MRSPDTNPDADELALRALVWTLAEPARAGRFLDLTGLTPGDLKARAGTPSVLGAVLGFLEANEPDLVACADELGVRPETLVRAREILESR